MNKRAIKIIAVLFIMSLGLAFLSASIAKAVECKAGYNFIGNTTTKIYHTATCPAAKKIAANNAAFYKTTKGAEKAGYTPCKTCKPDTTGVTGKASASPSPKPTTTK
jgi:methylphosphotriester-DNA--protein-cysteine methyltransferase